MRTRLLLKALKAGCVGWVLGGLALSGWIYAGRGHGVAWLLCGLLLSATVAAMGCGVVLVFHIPEGRS